VQQLLVAVAVEGRLPVRAVKQLSKARTSK
jgi:hypothetical protein